MRILMLGNSLTTANGLPDLLGTTMGAEVVVHARGGARLAEHLNPETRLGSLTSRALEDDSWDFVILQESSNGPIAHRERFLEAAARLSAWTAETGAQPILFATWAYAPTCPKLENMGITRKEMHERLSCAYEEAARENAAGLARVGDAFFDHAHSEALYRRDGVHPSAQGTALAVRVIAETLNCQVGRSSTTGDAHANSIATASVSPDSSGESESAYTVYILRCEDGSFYTGITTDMKRRLQEHLSRGPKAARYTRTHPVVAVEATFNAPNRAAASALEYRIKRLSHAEKLELINGTVPVSQLSEHLR